MHSADNIILVEKVGWLSLPIHKLGRFQPPPPPPPPPSKLKASRLQEVIRYLGDLSVNPQQLLPACTSELVNVMNMFSYGGGVCI